MEKVVKKHPRRGYWSTGLTDENEPHKLRPGTRIFQAENRKYKDWKRTG